MLNAGERFIKFLKYYHTKTPLDKKIIRDLFQDILIVLKAFHGIKANLQKIKEAYDKMDEDLSLSQKDILDGCCLLTYKKTNRYSEDIFSNQLFPDAMVFTQIAEERRNTIKELHNIGAIEIVHENISEDVLQMWEREGYFTIDQQGKRQIQLSFEKLVKSLHVTIPPTIDARIFQGEVRKLFDTIRNKIEYWIGEDEFNRQLNLDRSYQATCSFHADSETIQKLIDSLKKSEWKEYASQVYFKNGKMFVNENIFLIEQNKSGEFLSFLAQYFTCFPGVKQVTVWELVDFWVQCDIDTFKYLNANDIQRENIRTSLLRTLRKNLRKKYQNWDIFVIEKDTIFLHWEA